MEDSSKRNIYFWFVMIFIVLGFTFELITWGSSIAQKNTSVARAARAPAEKCEEYHRIAKILAEEKTPGGVYVANSMQASIAYSLLYHNCRDINWINGKG